MFAVGEPVWEMNSDEELFLMGLSEIVELYRVLREDDDGGIYYLSRERGEDGARALAHSDVIVKLNLMYVRREFILAVDLERQTVQVALPVREMAEA